VLVIEETGYRKKNEVMEELVKRYVEKRKK
jgi:hypothetical protein